MGNVTIGNPNHFLSQVFGLVQSSQEAQKYLFLNTIREIIIADSKCLETYIDELINLLISHTSVESQQIRNIVAEIVGRLLADFPEIMMDTISSELKSNNNLTIATMARSVKFAGSRLKHQMTLQFLTDDLISLRSSADIEVKKSALEALTSIIHSNWVAMK